MDIWKPQTKDVDTKALKHSSKFQNPLHQNYKHVQTLVSVLGLNDDQVHSVIVFVGDSKAELPFRSLIFDVLV